MKRILEELTENKNIFLWDPILLKGKKKSLLFKKPYKIFKLTTSHSVDDVKAVFHTMEELLKKGFFIAGWLSYELGYLLIKKLNPLILNKKNTIPLLWFGVYEKAIEIEQEIFDEFTATDIRPKLTLNVSKRQFISAINRIHDYIKSGDTYQINYTIKGKFIFNDNVESLYLALRKKQKVKYASFIKTGEGDFVLSLSPELFFKIEDGIISSKPMKGTAPRGKNKKDDEEIKQRLKKDKKNMAENVMIVDLLRNDIGKICQIGSVNVPNLFKVEKYDTLFQMISKVEGKLKNSVTLYDIIEAIFPCGSITGAPKIRSMEIIAELEKEPRGIYTGAIGYLTPDGNACFNVAIRTLHIKDGLGEIGIGAGITIGSDPEDEFKETILKAKFLTNEINY